MSKGEARRKSLGRGLDALLGGTTAAALEHDEAATDPEHHRASSEVPVDRIQSGRFQPRKHFDQGELESLADSIRSRGVVQPILLRPHPDDPDSYELIAGERRWLAAQKAGLHTVPAIVRRFEDSDALEIAIVENIQRQDLTPLEEADGYQRLMDEFGHTQDALAKALGKSRAHIANTLRLLTLPETIKAMLQDGRLSAGHGRALVTASEPEALAREAVERGWSVREIERRTQDARRNAAGHGGGKKRGSAGSGGAKAEKDVDTLALEQDLSRRLGLSVDIHVRGESGQLVIHYKSLEQLDDLLSRLSGDQSK